MTTNDLPEFDVSVQMVRKIGPDTERRTFTARVPAVDLQHAEAAAYGLGHGINDATRYGWKFEDVDPNVFAEPASDTKVDELTAALTQSRAQAATYANEIGTLTAENARLRQQRDAHADVVEAAKAWRAQFGEWGPLDSADTPSGDLTDAVDALPKAEATR